jgi:pimeloyl-ACP methyl ester carboxylesterase
MPRQVELVPIHGHATPRPDPRADVVFVHGLMGDPLTTWTAKAADGTPCSWPQWIADDFPEVAVWSVGYPTTVSKWIGRSMPLSETAIDIADLLLTKPVGVDRPMIFVGHSLGGLVIKKMILDSASDSRPRNKPLANNTRAIMFLATPHTGSDLPALGTFLETLAETLLSAGAGAAIGVPPGIGAFVAKMFGRRSTTMSELESNAPMLRDLNVRFRQYVESRRDANPIAISVYYETQPTWGRQVVTESSADPGLPTADLVPLLANHIDICKFAEKGDAARPYLRLSQLLASIMTMPSSPVRPLPAAVLPGASMQTATSLRPEAAGELADAAIAGPRPATLAVAECGLDDPGARVIVVACVVTDEPEELVTALEDMRTSAVRDPLTPEAAKRMARTADLLTLFDAAALRPRLLDRLATIPFSGYVYFGERASLGHVSTEEVRRRFLVQPLADRMRKKSRLIATAQGNRADLPTSLAIATRQVSAEQHRVLPAIELGSTKERRSRVLADFALFVASVATRYLAAPQDAEAVVLYEHLRTRLLFVKNVATNEVHTRDRNPLR